MEVDRLSALPDCLLVSILHHLCLKKAAQTALLSKQWRFLWTNLPLYFYEWSKETEQIRRFVAHVDAVLAPPRVHPLDALSFSFYYNTNLASDVDRWLDFAAKNKVKSLSLRLEHDYTVWRRHNHNLPQFIYTISSLTWLHLEWCTIELLPQTAVDWPCLRWLRLKWVKSSQQAIDQIISGCPLLESLSLEHCDGINHLEIGGRSFHSLTVTSDRSDLKEISAPYMRDLYIMVYFGRFRMKLLLENVQSLETAAIDFMVLDWDHMSVDEATCYTIKLFQDLRHVEHLNLDRTEVLSIMRRNGWRLPQCRAKFLSLGAASDSWGIYGVFAMLESSPYVEKLIISCRVAAEKNSIDFGPFIVDDLNSDLLHLKTVEFKYFDSSDFCGEPISTLAQILFKRCPVLEKMVICNEYLSIEEISIIKEMLIKYPKSSEKVNSGDSWLVMPSCHNPC